MLLVQTVAPANRESDQVALTDAAKCGGVYVVLAPTVEKLGDAEGSDALRVKYYTWLVYGDNVIKSDPRKYVGAMIESGLKDARHANQLKGDEKNQYWNRLLDQCNEVETALGDSFSDGKAQAEQTVKEQRQAKTGK